MINVYESSMIFSYFIYTKEFLMTDNIKLTVTGMKCGGCEKTITDTLLATEGVSNVLANHTENSVDVEFDSTVIEEDDLIEKIESAGFTVED